MFIPDLDLDFLSIPDPVVKKGTGSRIRIRNTALFIRTHPGLSVPEAPVPEAEPPAEEEGGAPAGKVKRSLSQPRATSPPPLLPPKRVKSEQALSAVKAKAPGREEPPSVQPRGLQRDVVTLGWPVAPSYMNPNAGGGGGWEWLGFSQ
jgi:hypothetical protein